MKVDKREKELKSRINVSRVPSLGKKDMEEKVEKFCGDSRDLSKSVKREKSWGKKKNFFPPNYKKLHIPAFCKKAGWYKTRYIQPELGQYSLLVAIGHYSEH